MSIDVHPGAPPAALHDIPATVEGEFGRDETWTETAITVAAAGVTIVFVSFVTVIMAMA